MSLTQAIAMMGVLIAFAIGTEVIQSAQLSGISASNHVIAASYAARNVLVRLRSATLYDTSGAVQGGISSATWTQPAPSPAPSATAAAATSLTGVPNGSTVAVTAKDPNGVVVPMQISVMPQAPPPGTTINTAP